MRTAIPACGREFKEYRAHAETSNVVLAMKSSSSLKLEVPSIGPRLVTVSAPAAFA